MFAAVVRYFFIVGVVVFFVIFAGIAWILLVLGGEDGLEAFGRGLGFLLGFGFGAGVGVEAGEELRGEVGEGDGLL